MVGDDPAGLGPDENPAGLACVVGLQLTASTHVACRSLTRYRTTRSGTRHSFHSGEATAEVPYKPGPRVQGSATSPSISIAELATP